MTRDYARKIQAEYIVIENENPQDDFSCSNIRAKGTEIIKMMLEYHFDILTFRPIIIYS